MEEIKDVIKKWKDILFSWIGRINIVKMAILPKATYRFNAIPIKIMMTLFTELEQINIKFMWNRKRPWIAKSWESRTELEISPSQTSDYCKAIVIKRTWYWHKNGYIDQLSRIKSPEINPYTYGKLSYDKGDKNIQWENKNRAGGIALSDFRLQTSDYKATINQNSLVLAQKQICRSMEQNREPRNKPTYLWSINLQ